MKILIESSVLVSDLGVVQKIIGKKGASNCTIAAANNRIRISGETIEGARKFAIYCECEVSEEGSATIDPSILSTALRNKGTIKLSVSDNTLHVVSVKGKYKAKFTCLPDAEVSIELTEGRNVTGELQEILFELLPKVSISSQYVETEIFAHIRVNSSGITVGCFDHYHGALCSSDAFTTEDSLEFRLPIQYIEILRSLRSTGLSFCIDDSSVTVYCDNYELVLPLLQSAEQSLEELEQLVLMLKSPKMSFTCGRLEFVDALKGHVSVYEQNTSTSVNVTTKSVTLTTESTYGSLKEKIPATDLHGVGKVSLYCHQVLDMAPLCKGNLQFNIYESVFTIFDTADDRIVYLGSAC